MLGVYGPPGTARAQPLSFFTYFVYTDFQVGGGGGGMAKNEKKNAKIKINF